MFKEKKIRQLVWNEIIEKTKEESGEPVPDWIKEKVNELLDKYEKTRNLRQFYAEFINEIQKTRELLKEAVSFRYHLEENCKSFLEKIINDCYKIDRRGIKRRLWKYMNQIDVISREVKTFYQIKRLSNNYLILFRWKTLSVSEGYMKWDVKNDY